ncbi:MAG: TIR domain-containing protein [Thermoplasmata archaeon]
MAYLAAKDVRNIEDRFLELLSHAPGTKEDKQAFFQRRMKVHIPRTNYEVMWDRLVDSLERGGAGEAVFDYVLATADAHLRRSLAKASMGQRVKMRRDEKVVVLDLFWDNGKLRRIGKHLVGYMAYAGKTPQVRERRAGKQITTRPSILVPRDLGVRDAFSPPERRFPYDIALSYASEQRGYVKRVYRRLRQLGVKTFYDDGEVVSLWGKNLEPYLEKVFRKMARLCVVFVSKDYVSKPWPLFEAQSALAREVQEKGEYVLPVRFDDSELSGLLPTIKYLRAQDYSPEQIAEIIRMKLEDLE